MATLTFIIWIVSLVFLAIAAFWPRPAYNMLAIGVFGFDLWLGLHFMIETSNRITF